MDTSHGFRNHPGEQAVLARGTRILCPAGATGSEHGALAL